MAKPNATDYFHSNEINKNYLASYNVYAEVRGKYARPAPVLNKSLKNYELNRCFQDLLLLEAWGLGQKGFLTENLEKKKLLTEKFYKPVTFTKVRSESMNKTCKSFYNAKIDENSVILSISRRILMVKKGIFWWEWGKNRWWNKRTGGNWRNLWKKWKKYRKHWKKWWSNSHGQKVGFKDE